MSVRAAYFDTATYLVTKILAGQDLNTFPDPEPGSELAILLDDGLEMPLYFNGLEIKPVPEQPGPEYIWDSLTGSWVADLDATSAARGTLMAAESAYYWERGFYVELDGEWRRVACDARNLGRLRDAAMVAMQIGPSDPFDMHIICDGIRPLTRDQALSLHALLCQHSKAVDEEVLRMQEANTAAYALAETDLAGAVAAMMAIQWTYFPGPPDEA